MGNIITGIIAIVVGVTLVTFGIIQEMKECINNEVTEIRKTEIDQLKMIDRIADYLLYKKTLTK